MNKPACVSIAAQRFSRSRGLGAFVGFLGLTFVVLSVDRRGTCGPVGRVFGLRHDNVMVKGEKREKGMTVQQRHSCSWGIVFLVVLVGMAQTLWAESLEKGRVIPVQVPYEAPPKGQNLPAESVPQNTKPLTAKKFNGRKPSCRCWKARKSFGRWENSCISENHPCRSWSKV